MAPTHPLDKMVDDAIASVSDSTYQLLLLIGRYERQLRAQVLYATAFIFNSILQLLLWIDSSMLEMWLFTISSKAQLMQSLHQFKVGFIAWASSSMSQPLLFFHAFASSSTWQPLPFFHQHEVEFLAFGLLSSLLISASLIHLVLPEIEEDYPLLPNEVDFEAEDFPLNTHRFLWVGFGVALLISNAWPILDLVERVSKRFTGYGLAMFAGVSHVFSSIGYLFAVHDPQHADGGHPLIRVVEDTTLASMQIAYYKSRAGMRIAFSQVKRYVWGNVQGLLSYITEGVIVVGMCLVLFALGILLTFFGDYVADGGPLHPLVVAVEDWTLERVRALGGFLLRQGLRANPVFGFLYRIIADIAAVPFGRMNLKWLRANFWDRIGTSDRETAALRVQLAESIFQLAGLIEQLAAANTRIEQLEAAALLDDDDDDDTDDDDNDSNGDDDESDDGGPGVPGVPDVVPHSNVDGEFPANGEEIKAGSGDKGVDKEGKELGESEVGGKSGKKRIDKEETDSESEESAVMERVTRQALKALRSRQTQTADESGDGGPSVPDSNAQVIANAMANVAARAKAIVATRARDKADAVAEEEKNLGESGEGGKRILSGYRVPWTPMMRSMWPSVRLTSVMMTHGSHLSPTGSLRRTRHLSLIRRSLTLNCLRSQSQHPENQHLKSQHKSQHLKIQHLKKIQHPKIQQPKS
jgi:hypothetical protein